MKTKVNLKFLLPLLAFMFSVGWATAYTSQGKDAPNKAEQTIVAEAISSVALEHKEAYKLDNAEYKGAVSTPTSFSSSGAGFSSFTGYLWKVVAVLGLVGLLFKQVKKKDLMIGASLFVAAVAVSIFFPGTDGVALAVAPIVGLDTMSLRELRDKGMKTFAQMEDIYRDKRDGKEITKDREDQFDKWDKELVAIEQEIRFKERKENIEMVEVRERGPKVPGTDIDTTEEKYDPKFQPEFRSVAAVVTKRNHNRKLNAEERRISALIDREHEVFEKFFRSGFNEKKLNAEEISIFENQQAREMRAQSTSTTAGGYTIPQGFIPNIIKSLQYISVFFEEFKPTPTAEAQNLFDVIKTQTGNPLPVPTGDDTSNTGELLAENADGSSSSADLVFGQKTLNAYQFSTKMIRTSNVLLQDTGIDLPSYIADMFGSRIGRAVNPYFTTGTGSSQPHGIITGATSGKISASTSATTFPEIIDLVHSVDPSYRKAPTCRFMMHDNILLYLKKLTVGQTTTNARPLWQPGYDVGAPATIDGYQYVINQGMASSVATGNKIILFGDMKAFYIRLVNDYRLLKLVERYAEFDQTAWIGFMRLDSRVKNASALKYLRIS